MKAFTGELAFLSNMFPCELVLNGRHFTCAEAAFQGCKDPARIAEFEGIDGYAARRLGKKVRLADNWNVNRVKYMRIIVREKFRQNPKLMKKLLETGDMPLVEENSWGDRFWGTVNGAGENHLGKILMEIREEGR